MSEEKKISFSAVDNGVNNFMKRLQQDTKALYSEFAADAKKQSASQKEQLKYIQDQIKALERANELEREQSKIILDRQLKNRVLSQNQYDKRLDKLNDSSAVNKLQTSMLTDFNKSATPISSISSKDEFIRASQSEAQKFQNETQGKGKSILADFTKIAQAQVKGQKEQSKLVHEQISDLSKKLQLEKEYLKTVLEGKAAMAEGPDKVLVDKELENLNSNSKKDKLLIEELRNEQNKRDKEIPDKKSSVFNDILKAGFFRDLMGLVRSIPNAQTGLDLVSPFSSIAGGAAGGMMGTAMDAANIKILGTGLGNTQAGTILANVGKEAGGFMGDAITRSFRLRNEYDNSYLGYRGLTGTNLGTPDLTSMGFDDTRVAQTMVQIARSAGTPDGGRSSVTGIFGLSRGFGIEEGDSMSAMAMQRSGAGSGMTNMQRGLGVALAEGISRTKLGDVIRNQTSLLQQFSLTKTTVSSEAANKALFEFNRMGGPFSIGDPRSIQNIQGINSDLSSPGSPFGQALNYSVLRRLKGNENAGVFDLMRQQEQGLQTPGFLKGVIDDVTGMGGSEDFQKLMLKGRLPSLNFDAIDTLFKQKDKLGSMSEKSLSEMLDLDNIESQGQDLTSLLMRSQAEVANAFRDNFIEGISVLKNQFVTEMGLATEEVANILKRQFGLEDDPKSKVVKSKVPFKNGATTSW
jgi:hypothetical protein